MQAHVRTRILQLTGAEDIARTELIQPLWNNYGTLSRVFLRGGAHLSVIVKHIQIPEQLGHPRGFASAISQDRKIRSYQVETHWYRHQNQQMPEGSPSPKCLDAFAEEGELFLLLEDLATRGFDQALYYRLSIGFAPFAWYLAAVFSAVTGAGSLLRSARYIHAPGEDV